MKNFIKLTDISGVEFLMNVNKINSISRWKTSKNNYVSRVFHGAENNYNYMDVQNDFDVLVDTLALNAHEDAKDRYCIFADYDKQSQAHIYKVYERRYDKNKQSDVWRYKKSFTTLPDAEAFIRDISEPCRFYSGTGHFIISFDDVIEDGDTVN